MDKSSKQPQQNGSPQLRPGFGRLLMSAQFSLLGSWNAPGELILIFTPRLGLSAAEKLVRGGRA